MKVTITNENILDKDNNTITNIRHHYNDEVILQHDLRFGELINSLLPHIKSLKQDFKQETGGWDISKHFNQIQKEPTQDLNLKSINFQWIYDSLTEVNLETNKEETTLDEYLNLNSKGFDDIIYSLSFVELNNLKYTPVILNNNTTITNYHIDKKEYKELITFQKPTTLRQLLSSLLTEITFFGEPEHIEETKKQMLKNTDEFEDSLKTTISLTDIEIEFLNKDLEKALSQENYEWAQRIKDKIDKLTNN